jgi:hypothetical protein
MKTTDEDQVYRRRLVYLVEKEEKEEGILRKLLIVRIRIQVIKV